MRVGPASRAVPDRRVGGRGSNAPARVLRRVRACDQEPSGEHRRSPVGAVLWDTVVLKGPGAQVSWNKQWAVPETPSHQLAFLTAMLALRQGFAFVVGPGNSHQAATPQSA